MRLNSKAGRAAHERGFTLVELVMAMGVSVIILAAVGYAILQVFNVNTRNTNHMSAVRNAQAAGYWISHDALMALPETANVTAGFPATFPLQLSWYEDPNNPTSTTHRSIFTISNGILFRQYDNQPATRIAEHITTATFPTVTMNPRGHVVSFVFNVTASIRTRNITETETRQYEVALRPSDK